MFVTRKALIGVFVLLLCFGALVYKTRPDFFQGEENIVIEISSDSDSSTTIDKKSEDTKEKVPENQSSDTEHTEKDPTEPLISVDDIMQPTVDLSASSPQPSKTIEPRGHHDIVAVPESSKRIGDSWDHVKDTKELMEFVHSQCEKYHQITAEPGEAKKPRMLIMPKNWRQHMILYSSNPKTGSTSFKKWYTRIQGDTRPYEELTGVHVMKKYGNIEEAWVLAKTVSNDPTLADMIKPFYKVGFMRNPLTRLISGFRDKILRRKQGGLTNEMVDIDRSLTVESSDAAKFAAFADGVMKGTIKNFHFVPQHNKMKICDFPYDLIAQTETTSQQIVEVQEHTNTTQYDFPGSRSETGFDSVGTVHLAHEFYDKVKPDIMDKIYQYYKWDFVLMGYTKLSNPNFPYLDFEQDFEKEYGPLDWEDVEPTKPFESTRPVVRNRAPIEINNWDSFG